MTTTTRQRPSYIRIPTIDSGGMKEAIRHSKKPIPTTCKSRRLSLQSGTGSGAKDGEREQQQQYYDRVPWTPTLLSDSTMSSYFHDDISNSVLLTKQPSAPPPPPPPAADWETRSLKTTDAKAMAADDMPTKAMQQPPNFEGHVSYKIKTAKSSRKLDCFFGEQAPHDICIKEIRKEGLKAMLQSKIPLCYFLYHLLKEYSSENLFFFIEVEQYEPFEYTSVVQQFATAQHIHNTYLTRNSYFEVNLDDKVRRTVTDALREKRVQGCFTTAKRAVYDLLASSYMRFLQTDTFEMMVHNCGELTTHYNATARNAGPQLLMQYLEQQHAMIYTNPHTDQTAVHSIYNQSYRRRHELIRSMIQGFCRTMLNVHIECLVPPGPSSTQSHSILRPFDFITRLRHHHH